MSSQAKTFDFVKLNELPEKPRKTGVIEFRGPYYTPVTYGYLSDLLDDWGEYVDGFKFAGGSMRLLDREKTRKMIQLCHEHDVYVSTGGFVERVIVQGPEAVDKYLEECKSLGFDMVEVSSGLAPIKLEDKFGYHTWMFEASDPPVFKWYLKTFGKDVNLFIDHSQIVEFNAWRLGLWGDPNIWKGKNLSYPSTR